MAPRALFVPLLALSLLVAPARASASGWATGPLPLAEPVNEPAAEPDGLAFSLELSLRRGDAGDAFGGLALLTIPLDRLARRSTFAQSAPRLKPTPRGRRDDEAPAPASAPAPAEAPPAPPPELPTLPVRLTRTLARAAVDAALRHAGLADGDARLDALASRARSSALLPELRLRAMRQIDASENLAPTEYDPERITATGGTSTWLEARATWRFDRLLFADDEVPLERMRHERGEARSRLTARVLELLAAWQRARLVEDDAARPVDERVEAMLKALETEAALDVVTGGWFGRRSAADAG